VFQYCFLYFHSFKLSFLDRIEFRVWRRGCQLEKKFFNSKSHSISHTFQGRGVKISAISVTELFPNSFSYLHKFSKRILLPG